MLVICIALGLILWICCLYTETTRSRHQQQREQRADRFKERRPPKPVRKVHRAAPSSDLNAKPGIIILFLCERANTLSHLFWLSDIWKAKHVEQSGRILSRVSAHSPRVSNIELPVYLEGFFPTTFFTRLQVLFSHTICLFLHTFCWYFNTPTCSYLCPPISGLADVITKSV